MTYTSKVIQKHCRMVEMKNLHGLLTFIFSLSPKISSMWHQSIFEQTLECGDRGTWSVAVHEVTKCQSDMTLVTEQQRECHNKSTRDHSLFCQLLLCLLVMKQTSQSIGLRWGDSMLISKKCSTSRKHRRKAKTNLPSAFF